jgi:phospholipid transport system substrate-binding protein
MGVLVPSLLTAGMARAEATKEQAATAVVTGLVEQILAVLQRGALSQEGSALMATIEQRTDLTLLARLAMGRHWRSATSAQQTAYVELFRRYVLQSFLRRLSQVAPIAIGSPAEHFTILTAHAVDDDDVLVSSRVVPPGGRPIRVDWRLRTAGGGAVIIDLLVEGVSLLINQRAEFSAVLERAGVDGLLAALRQRLEQA